MFVMRKANKIVRVSEDELERYIYRGFDLVNDKGTIIKNNSELHKELYNEQRAEYFKNQKVAELLKELKKDKWKLGGKKSMINSMKFAGGGYYLLTRKIVSSLLIFLKKVVTSI